MKTFSHLCLPLVLVITTVFGVALAGGVPTAGDRLVAIRLQTPVTADKRDYLGVAADGTFAPTDIAGRLLIIEIFNMYCPHCQREAPAVNRLYQAIDASEDLRGRVKMIGIGVGNSTYEVNYFRKYYKIGFPLFPDENFAIHRSLGGVRTPYFIISAIGSADRGKILWTGSGKMGSLQSFLTRLNALLKQGEAND
jgi:thiol-disulfide isomerase/thioredoxin